MPKATPVTRNDVAQYAGVSTAVVSYVVNEGPRPVAPETRDRVLEAIRVLGYRPNATARALRMGTTRTFGLITPDGGNPLFAELAKAIDKEAAARGYVVLQTGADGDPATEQSKIAELLIRRVSGLLLVAPTEDPDLSETDIPVIAINRVLPTVSSVRPQYREGARRGVEHLLEHGHRRIGLVIGGGRSGERELGWRDALRAAGLDRSLAPPSAGGAGMTPDVSCSRQLIGRRPSSPAPTCRPSASSVRSTRPACESPTTSRSSPSTAQPKRNTAGHRSASYGNRWSGWPARQSAA